MPDSGVPDEVPPWPTRARLLTALTRLAELANREANRVQPGDALDNTLVDAWLEVNEARCVYIIG